MIDILWKIVLGIVAITCASIAAFGVAIWWLLAAEAFIIKLIVSWLLIFAGLTFGLMAVIEIIRIDKW